MVGNANLSLLADVAHGVGICRLALGWDENAQDILIEIVVGKNHAAISAVASVGPVDIAVEEIVLGGTEGRLNVVIELGDDVVHLAEICTDI